MTCAQRAGAEGHRACGRWLRRQVGGLRPLYRRGRTCECGHARRGEEVRGQRGWAAAAVEWRSGRQRDGAVLGENWCRGEGNGRRSVGGPLRGCGRRGVGCRGGCRGSCWGGGGGWAALGNRCGELRDVVVEGGQIFERLDDGGGSAASEGRRLGLACDDGEGGEGDPQGGEGLGLEIVVRRDGGHVGTPEGAAEWMGGRPGLVNGHRAALPLADTAVSCAPVRGLERDLALCLQGESSR